MPKTKTQGIIFGIIMSYAMAYGMEVYNIAIKEGINLAAGGFSNMTNLVFWDALKEALYMGVFVSGETVSDRPLQKSIVIRKRTIPTYASF